MPQLGLGTEIGRGTGGVTDPDALAYFTTAGIGSDAVTPTTYDSAANFNGTSQYLSSSLASITLGTSWTACGWFNKNDITTTGFLLNFGNNRKIYINTVPQITFECNGGNAITAVSAIPTNQWVFWCARVSPSGNFISLNAGTESSGGTAADYGSTTALKIGVDVSGTSSFFGGSQCGISVFNTSLSSTQITALYNKGIGLTYSGMVSAGLTTNLVSYWALNQNSVTADSAGSNTLTNNGSVTASAVSPIASATASSRQLINSFVKGVKGLGLWSNMVSWPLRNSQNASSTLTAYSLGGAGTYNGTLVNTPSSNYASNGLNFVAGHSSKINLPDIATSGTDITMMTTQSAPSGNLRPIDMQSGTVSLGIWAGYSNSYFWDARSASDSSVRINGGPVPTAMQNTIGVANSTGSYFYQNNSLILSQVVTPCSLTTPLHGNSINQLGGNGTIAFASVFNATADPSTLYALYKQTLGLGLALP